MKEEIRGAKNHMLELSDGEVADENESCRCVEPPIVPMQARQCFGLEVLHHQRDDIATGRPWWEFWLDAQLGDRDTKAFDDETLREDQKQERDCDPVVGHGMKATGLYDAAVIERHEQAHDAEDSKAVAQQGVIEVEGALEKLDARPLLN